MSCSHTVSELCIFKALEGKQSHSEGLDVKCSVLEKRQNNGGDKIDTSEEEAS